MNNRYGTVNCNSLEMSNVFLSAVGHPGTTTRLLFKLKPNFLTVRRFCASNGNAVALRWDGSGGLSSGTADRRRRFDPPFNMCPTNKESNILLETPWRGTDPGVGRNHREHSRNAMARLKACTEDALCNLGRVLGVLDEHGFCREQIRRH